MAGLQVEEEEEGEDETEEEGAGEKAHIWFPVLFLSRPVNSEKRF